MVVMCWSSKGGSGTTVVAAVLASVLAASTPTLLVDLGGDLPAALGRPEPVLGLADWARGLADATAPSAGDGPAGRREQRQARGLGRLEVDGAPGVRLLPRGAGPLDEAVGPALVRELRERACVVVDGGVVGGSSGRPGLVVGLAGPAAASLLVIRPCFLALRRAVAAPLRPSGVVLVAEPQRVLGPSDVEAALGVPVVAVVPWDPGVARRVDAGLLGAAPPRALARALRGVAATAGPRARTA